MYTRAVQGIIYAASSQDLARKFAMKLSATVTPRWEGVVSRGEATHRDFKQNERRQVKCKIRMWNIGMASRSTVVPCRL